MAKGLGSPRAGKHSPLGYLLGQIPSQQRRALPPSSQLPHAEQQPRHRPSPGGFPHTSPSSTFSVWQKAALRTSYPLVSSLLWTWAAPEASRWPPAPRLPHCCRASSQGPCQGGLLTSHHIHVGQSGRGFQRCRGREQGHSSREWCVGHL